MDRERLFLRLDDDPLYAPETTVPAGTMRELAVPAALREHVAHVIAYDEHLPAGTVVTERVLPDGALRLIFDVAAGTAQVAGPSARPVLLSMRGHLQGLSVTLRAGASLALLGVPAQELAERVVPWDDVVPAPRRGLHLRLQEAGRDGGRARILHAALGAMARGVDGNELRKARGALGLLLAGAEQASLRSVAAAVGVGERRLQQIFQAQLGLSPRAWRRLARMQGCLRLLREDPAASWSDVALQGGFYDQSHLVNEFRALCGLTPGEFLQRRVSHSSKTAD